MQIRTRVLAGVSVVVSVIAIGGLAATATAAVRPSTTTTYTVDGDHVQCQTLTGTIAFATKLSFAGPTTGSETATIKGLVNGCTDSDNANVNLFSGTITGAIHTSNGWNCTALFGPQPSSASAMTIVWKPAKNQAFAHPDPVTLKPTSKFTVNGDVGGFFTIADDNNVNEGTWTGDAYGAFKIGAQYGGAPNSGATELFTGGDAGINGSLNTATQLDIQTSATLCTGAGIAKEAIGLGQVTLG
jgi:hypothetical protein